jgi:uncharacterized membrane protein
MKRDGGTAHRLFRWGVIVKGVDGALEVVGGIVALVIDPQTLSAAVRVLTSHELSEDPADRIASLLRHVAEHVSSATTLFAGAYLLGHGLVKLLLMVGLLRERLWVFPAALGFLGVFVAYQSYRGILAHSIVLALLTALDLAVVLLVWLEYRHLRRARARGGGG